MLRIGLISDTHGLLRPEAVAALQGCDRIVHGGDIGAPGILEALSAIAPVTAVRGNNDRAEWAAHLPDTASLVLNGVRLHVLHDVATLDVDPVEEGVHVVVSGHSHKPQVVERNGVLFVNPGSAGPRRFKLPIAVGELSIDGSAVRAKIVTIA